MKILTTLILLVVVTYRSEAQYIDTFGGSLGIRLNTFEVQAKEGVTRAGEGISSTYHAGFNLGKVLASERLIFYSGIHYYKEQLDYHPALMLHEIQQFKSIANDTLTVSKFRLWNNQVGIPIKFSLPLYQGFTKLGPLFMLPAIHLNVGVLNNFMVRKGYNDVVLIQNYGKTNANFYYDDEINAQVSSFYVKTISNYNLIGQIGLDFSLPKAYADMNTLNYGINVSLNRYLVSPLLQEIKIVNRTSVDLQIFITAPINRL